MLLTGLKLQARAAARRAGFSVIGSLFLLVGLGFLTAAGWIVLADRRDALFAALVIGGIYVGIGLIFFALASRRYVRVPVAPPPTGAYGPRLYTYAVPALLEAFMVGISAGMVNRSRADDEKKD